MKHFRYEFHLGRTERVVGGEDEFRHEHPSFKGTVFRPSSEEGGEEGGTGGEVGMGRGVEGRGGEGGRVIDSSTP